MQLERRSLKKISASTGFEPVTSVIRVQCSTNWAMKPHFRCKVNLLSSYLPWGVKWCEVYLSEFARSWPLKFSLKHGRSPCSSHCGRSKWRGIAIKARFSKQPWDSSNSLWVTLSCVSKAQEGEGCCFETWLQLEYVASLSETLQCRMPWKFFLD